MPTAEQFDAALYAFEHKERGIPQAHMAAALAAELRAAIESAQPEQVGVASPVVPPEDVSFQITNLMTMVFRYGSLRIASSAHPDRAGKMVDSTYTDILARVRRLATPADQSGAAPSTGDAETFVRDLLWNDHPECCGSPVVGAEYMGQQEMVCCGNPEPAPLNEKQIVATLRARFPNV